MIYPGVVASSKTNHLFTRPNAPTIGTVTINSYGLPAGVTVTWSAPSYTTQNQPTNYYVYLNNSSGNTLVSGPIAFGTNTSTFNVNCSANTAYWFTVIASNTAGLSAYSGNSSTVYPNNPPFAPTIGSASISTYVNSASSTGSAGITVSWSAPTITNGNTPTSYKVFDNYGVPWGTIAYPNTSTTVTVTNAQALTAYTFSVAAINASGQGPNSGASNQVTPFTIPTAPTIGTATRVSNTQVSVAFTAGSITSSSPATTYSVYDNVTGTTVSGTSSPITITETYTQGNGYTFKVLASNGAGSSAYSTNSNSVTPNPSYVAPTVSLSSLGYQSSYATIGAAWTGTATASSTGASETYTFSASGTALSTISGCGGMAVDASGVVSGTVAINGPNPNGYTLTVTATGNTSGLSSSASTNVYAEGYGEHLYSVAGTYTFTVPTGPLGIQPSVAFMCVGGGGGGAGYSPTYYTGKAGGSSSIAGISTAPGGTAGGTSGNTATTAGGQGAYYFDSSGNSANYTNGAVSGNVGHGGYGTSPYNVISATGRDGGYVNNSSGGNGQNFGGGGGCGNASGTYPGGGGGGTMASTTNTLYTSMTSASYTVTVGAGGARSSGTYSGGSGGLGMVRIVWGGGRKMSDSPPQGSNALTN